MASLRLKGAALAWRFQSGLKAICGTLLASAQRAAMSSAPVEVPPGQQGAGFLALSGRHESSLTPVSDAAVMRTRPARRASILKWSRHDLAVATGVPLWFVVAFEDEREDAAAFLAHYELAVGDALEAPGITFPFGVSNGAVTKKG